MLQRVVELYRELPTQKVSPFHKMVVDVKRRVGEVAAKMWKEEGA